MASDVFEGVHYYIVDNSAKNVANVKTILKKGGASREFYISELVTHVISDAPVDSETLPLQGQDHVIVNSDWVVMSQKCGAQLPVAPYESSKGKLFTDLVFCPSKLSVSDVEKLCVLLLFHGGKMQRRLDSKVTHLITVETTGAKYESAQQHQSVEVVTPDWIVDSIDVNMRLEEENFHPSRLGSMDADHQVSREACNGGLPSETVSELPRQPPCQPPGPIGSAPSQGDAGVKAMFADLEDGATTRPAPLDRPAAVGGPVEGTGRPSPAPQAAEKGVGGGAEEKTTPTSGKAEQLLDGVVICFTDYQHCVDVETMEKWQLVVRQHGGQVLDSYDSIKCTHLLALHKKSAFFTKAFGEKKCVASAHWLNDVLTEQMMFPPRNPIHFPTAFQWQLPNAEHYSMTLTNYADLERELVKDMLRICGIRYTGHLSRENTHLICKRPDGKKYEKALEWGVKVVNSTFLADIIHNGLLPAVLLPRHTALDQPEEFNPKVAFEASRILDLWKPFLKEYSSRHPELLDRSVSSNQEQEAAGVAVLGKRVRQEETSQDCSGVGADAHGKMRRESEERDHLPPMVLFTGVNTSVVKSLKQIVLKLRGVVTENPRECTHIVTPRVARTIKFLSGISICKYVVTPKWVEESGSQGTFVAEAEFFLKDSEAEQLFGMDLTTSLSRARERKLLEGVCVYATPTVLPLPSALREIVDCAGGQLLAETPVGAGLAGKGEPGTLLVLSTPADIASGCCKEFIAENIKLYNAELILTGVLKQFLDYSQYTFSIDV